MTGNYHIQRTNKLRNHNFLKKGSFWVLGKKDHFWEILSVTHQHQKANWIGVMKHPGLKEMILSSGIQSIPVCYYQQWSAKRFCSSSCSYPTTLHSEIHCFWIWTFSLTTEVYSNWYPYSVLEDSRCIRTENTNGPFQASTILSTFPICKD